MYFVSANLFAFLGVSSGGAKMRFVRTDTRHDYELAVTLLTAATEKYVGGVLLLSV
jgi:hypothetical protein